ncbi:MAG TPA: CBS domain-containing protein, partial [Spirochaetales bacterium]|nr:CBS domain-containing protein [Spirochaetales bacterium]
MEWETLNIETLSPEEEEAASPIQDTLINQEGTVLHRVGNIAYQKGTVYQLVSNQWFVFEDAKVIDLADDLSRVESAYAVSVTDKERRLLGVIKRKEFFDLLGHPFGRDLLSRATIDSVMEKIPVFPITENIFTVADELESACLKQDESYYTVVDDRGRFCGMFSSKDLL